MTIVVPEAVETDESKLNAAIDALHPITALLLLVRITGNRTLLNRY